MAKISQFKATLFQPRSVLAISIGAGLVFALLVTIRYTGDHRLFYLYYNVPMAIPFVAFLLDRAERWRELRQGLWLIDLPLVALSLSRAFVAIPLISGHVLFLTYVIVSSRSWVARLTALIVLLEVTALKVLAWYDTITPLGGALLGISAGFLSRWLFGQRRHAAG